MHGLAEEGDLAFQGGRVGQLFIESRLEQLKLSLLLLRPILELLDPLLEHNDYIVACLGFFADRWVPFDMVLVRDDEGHAGAALLLVADMMLIPIESVEAATQR